jgi:hypothetical protein
VACSVLVTIRSVPSERGEIVVENTPSTFVFSLFFLFSLKKFFFMDRKEREREKERVRERAMRIQFWRVEHGELVNFCHFLINSQNIQIN